MSVKVAIRVRPFNERQKFLGCICCVQMKQNTTVLYQNKEKNKKQHYFTFDHSFWSHDQYTTREDGYMMPTTTKYVDQLKVYNIIGKEMLENAWQGYNCCLFAYGQTGAGKSYSMIGYGVNRGIIPMICEQIFQKIKKNQRKGEKEFQITLSMLQIYNEKVQDLFVPTSKRPQQGLKIRQNKTLGVYVQGLTKYQVYSYPDIERRMDQGSKNRSLASTLMNEYSSRAHTIIMLQFIQKQWINKLKMNKKSSYINLVDLAGSERVSKTGIIDNKDRLKQASNINKSLHTLGRVIQTLAMQGSSKGKSAPVPYRDSALTRILEGALGGNSKTTMICAISPASDNYEQSLSTLRYADQTKKIKNKPIVNESAVDKIIRQLRQQNERLKKLLESPDELANSRGPSQSQKKEIRSNLRASMREVQKQIKKNLKSFAINTNQIQEEEQSLMMTEFIDLEEPSQFFSQLSFDLGNKAQVYITNLNEDEQLNYKVRYSCERDILITNKNNKKTLKGMQDFAKIVLTGLGVEQNHAKIIKKGDKYYIQALSDMSSEYTLVNGKPVYERCQLLNNDRIIIGTSSVFVFKNNLVKSAGKQERVDYEFAINQRQRQMENLSLIPPSSLNLFLPTNFIRDNKTKDIYAGPPTQALNATKRLLGPENETDILNTIEQIESEFQKLKRQNQQKMREKQQHYRTQLYQIRKEKQRQKEEKINLEQKLMIKSIESESLKTKNSQLQKLKKNLSKFVDEKKRRQKVRESMLLQSDDIRNSVIEEDIIGQFIQVENPNEKYRNKIEQEKIPLQRGDKYSKNNKKNEKKVNFKNEYEDVLVQQFEDNEQIIKTVINPRQSTDSLLLNDEQVYFKQAQKVSKSKEMARNQMIKKQEEIARQIMRLQQKQRKILQFQFRRLYNIKILCEIDEDHFCDKCSSKMESNLQSKNSDESFISKYVSPVEYQDAQLQQYHYKKQIQKKKIPVISQEDLLILSKQIEYLENQLLEKQAKQKQTAQNDVNQDDLLLNYSMDRSLALRQSLNPNQISKLRRQSFSIRKLSGDQSINFNLSLEPQFPSAKVEQLKQTVTEFIQVLANLPQLQIYQQGSFKILPIKKQKPILRFSQQISLNMDVQKIKNSKNITKLQELQVTIFNHKQQKSIDQIQIYQQKKQQVQQQIKNVDNTDQKELNNKIKIVGQQVDLLIQILKERKQSIPQKIVTQMIETGINTQLYEQQFINDRMKGSSFTAFLSEQLQQTNHNQTQSFNHMYQRQKITKQCIQYATNTEWIEEKIVDQVENTVQISRQVKELSQIGIMAVQQQKYYQQFEMVTDINMSTYCDNLEQQNKEESQIQDYIQAKYSGQANEQQEIQQYYKNKVQFNDQSINTEKPLEIQKKTFSTNTTQVIKKTVQTNTIPLRNFCLAQVLNITIQQNVQSVQDNVEDDQVEKYMKQKEQEQQIQGYLQNKIDQQQQNLVQYEKITYEQIGINTSRALSMKSYQIQVELNKSLQFNSEQSPIHKLAQSETEQRNESSFKIEKVINLEFINNNVQISITPQILKDRITLKLQDLEKFKQQLKEEVAEQLKAQHRDRPEMIDQQIQMDQIVIKISEQKDESPQKRQGQDERSEDHSLNNKSKNKNKSVDALAKSKQHGNSQQFVDKFNLSVSDIQKHQTSYQELSVFAFDSLLKQDDLNSKIKLLQQKIKELEASSQIKETENKIIKKDGVIEQMTHQNVQQTQEQTQLKNSLQQMTKGEEQQSNKNSKYVPIKRNKKKKKKNQMTPEERREHEIQKELQAKIIQCNNQNIINERSLQIHKRKREAEELKKILVRKQKVELQKQLLLLIPMVRRFNLIAREMKRLIQGKISVQYRNFSHYEMVQILKSYTVNKKRSGDNIQIKIVILNCQEGRIYTWPVDVFKNRYQISQQSFQKFLEADEDGGSGRHRMFDDRSQKSKDPFWDPVDYIAQGVSYLSMQPLLYNLSYEGYISIVYKSAIIAKLFVTLTPVKVKKQNDDQGQNEQEEESQLQNIQINNHRNLLEKDIYFTVSIESIKFMKADERAKSDQSNQNINLTALNSNILKYTISYDLFENDYKLVTFTTPQIDFVEDKQFKRIDYMRRHCFKNMSEATLAYISDCPIKFQLNVMKDYNQECLNASFTDDMSQSDHASSQLDTSHISGHSQGTTRSRAISEVSAKDVSKEPPSKSMKSDFSKKPVMIYQNTEIVTKLETQAKKQQDRRDTIAKLQDSRNKIAKQQKYRDKDKDKDKDCNIY